jgi:hypothetical protein
MTNQPEWHKKAESTTVPHEPFLRMLQRAEELRDQKFLEFAVIQCHITLDFFINLVLETHFLPRLDVLRETNPNILSLFLKATWEEHTANRYVSFLDKYGEYSAAIGVPFKGHHLHADLKQLNSMRDRIVHNRYFQGALSPATATDFVAASRAIIAYYLQCLNAATSVAPLLASYEFLDPNARITMSEGDEKTAELCCEATVRGHLANRNGIIIPSPQVQPKGITLQICGIDYSWTGAAQHTDQSLLPSWIHPNLFQIRLNLKLWEPFRDAASLVRTHEVQLAAFLEDIVARETAILFRSWRALSFEDHFRMHTKLGQILRMSALAIQLGPVRELLLHDLEFFMAEPSGTAMFRSFGCITAKPGHILLTGTKHPAEADMIRRLFTGTNVADLLLITPAYGPTEPE